MSSGDGTRRHSIAKAQYREGTVPSPLLIPPTLNSGPVNISVFRD